MATPLLNQPLNFVRRFFPFQCFQNPKLLIHAEILLENKKIPANIDYKAIGSLATEAVDRLSVIQPATIAQASRISGVTPSDIAILSVYVEQGSYETVEN